MSRNHRNTVRWIHCAECGRNRLHYAHGLCMPCYGYQYSQEHVEEIRESRRQRRQDNLERYNASVRAWRKANPEKVRAQKRRSHIRNAERNKERANKWRMANPERKRENDRAWREANPDKVRANKHRRRALKLNATIGPVDEAAIYARDKVCIYCGTDENLTIDHLTPLARGGPHQQDNLAVACRRCNSSKGAKTYEEFICLKSS